MKTVMQRLRDRHAGPPEVETVELRLPRLVMDDIREIAATLGWANPSSLLRNYIGRGLRADKETLRVSGMQVITDSLRAAGVSDEVIAAAMYEWREATGNGQRVVDEDTE